VENWPLAIGGAAAWDLGSVALTAAVVALSRGWLCAASALLTRLAEAPHPCLNAQGVQEAYVLRDATGRTLLHAALCSVAPAAATALLTRHAGFRAGHGRLGLTASLGVTLH
jgi:hypothetical protein